MRKLPYTEIIDLRKEQKEYARLCGGKSERFKLYSEWEKHIKEQLSTFQSAEDRYNFKHYCINAARTQERTPEMYLGYVGLVIPIYINMYFKDIPLIVMLVIFAIIFGYSITQNKKLARESCFFKDLLDILERIENGTL